MMRIDGSTALVVRAGETVHEPNSLDALVVSKVEPM